MLKEKTKIVICNVVFTIIFIGWGALMVLRMVGVL